jgi:NAD(P)-dependent dehydrogenase (short-subunit alcohol dehydrogenase family)
LFIGIAQSEPFNWTKSDIDDFEKVMAINVRGMTISMMEEIKKMRSTSRASIVNLSSIGGKRAAPGR